MVLVVLLRQLARKYHLPQFDMLTALIVAALALGLAQRVWIVLFTQCMMDSPESQKIFTDFWTLAYGAME